MSDREPRARSAPGDPLAPRADVVTLLSRPRPAPPTGLILVGGPEGLPPRQQLLADALLEQPEVFAYGSVQQVARKFGVDSVSILRFAQSLGCSGYRALQARVRSALLLGPARPRRSTPAATAAAVRRLEAARARHLSELRLVHRGLRPADLDRAAALLVEARRVLVTGAGAGAASALAGLLCALLTEAGVSAAEIPASGPAVPAGAGDVVVGIDLGPPGVERALEAARAGGAATVAIAAAGAARSSRWTVTLCAAARGPGLPLSPVAAAAVVELLAAEAAGRRAAATPVSRPE